MDRIADARIANARIADACLCLALRKSARRIARRYDAAFAPLGLTSGQVSLLAALSQAVPVPMGKLAAVLGLDRTTLTRNLKPILAAGLTEEVAHAKDARLRDYRLTEAGQALLVRALPVWEALQAHSTAQLPPEAWNTLKRHLADLT